LRLTVSAAHAAADVNQLLGCGFQSQIGRPRLNRPMHPLAQLDHAHLWHPFTQMREWLNREPIVIASGKGAILRDVHGREYLDGNSAIWTNLHGHISPRSTPQSATAKENRPLLRPGTGE
jgi:hypothetical protein